MRTDSERKRSRKTLRYRILLEDEDIVCVYKPPGMLSQGDRTGDTDLLTLLKFRYRSDNEFVGLVHRLDRPACGVMVFARSSAAANNLSLQLRKQKFKKMYLAVIHGRPEKTAILEDHLHIDRKNRRSRVAETQDIQGAPVALEYKVLDVHADRSLVQIHLLTGKKHQIRAQFSQRGFPIVGDRKYGSREVLRDPGMIALCAWKLEFKHPTYQQLVSVMSPRPQHWPWHKPSLFKPQAG